MVEYKNILYCTDYSEDAEIALVHAVDFAKRYGARLHIIHVLDSPHRYMHIETTEEQPKGAAVSVTPELLEEVARKIKDRYQNRLEGLEDVVWEVVPGVAFVEIVRYARENDVDLIVMGTTGKSELDRISYGSTVENVSRRAHCHVVAIRNPEKTYTL